MLKKAISNHNRKTRQESIDRVGMWTLAIVVIAAIVLGIFYGSVYLPNCSTTEKEAAILEEFAKIAEEHPEEIKSIEITLNDYPETFVIESGKLQNPINPVVLAIGNSIDYSIGFLVVFVFAWFIIFMIIRSILLAGKERSWYHFTAGRYSSRGFLYISRFWRQFNTIQSYCFLRFM